MIFICIWSPALAFIELAARCHHHLQQQSGRQRLQRLQMRAAPQSEDPIPLDADNLAERSRSCSEQFSGGETLFQQPVDMKSRLENQLIITLPTGAR